MKLEKKKLIVASILIVLFMEFMAPHSASAQSATPPTPPIGTCRRANTNPVQSTQVQCETPRPAGLGGIWEPTPPTTPTESVFSPDSFWACATQPFSCATKAITLIINGLLALLIALAAGLMRITLQFNDNVVNMPAVQAGFGVTLAIANLGFVLAIIVIAIATILRSQTYGVKQLLGKLIVAAIVVNFSLVIAGAILGFSSSLTRYFIQGSIPFNGPAPVLSLSAGADYVRFVNNITQAFGPQGAYGPPSLSQIQRTCTDENPRTYQAWLCTTSVGVSTALLNKWLPGGFLSQIIASAFSIIFLLIVFIMFLVITGMLLIRFVWIAILLITAPLVWLLWIFPNTKSHFTKWWSHFIRWAFFPPIVVFFLYLAILTTTKTNRPYLDANSISPGANSKDLPESAIMVALKDALGFNLIPQLEQGIILVGFALGGLFAANALSITGASMAIGLAKSAGAGIQGFAFKQGKRGAGALVPTKVKEKLEGGGYRFVPKRLQAAIGAGFRKVERAGGADQVEAKMREARDLWKNDPEAAKRLLNSGQGPGLRGGVSSDLGLALMKVAAEEGKTKGLKIGGKSLKKFVEDNEGLLQGYGQGKAFDKSTLSNKAMRDAEKALEAAKAAGTGIKDAANRLNEATKNFVDGLEKADMYKAGVNEVFGEKTDRSEALAKAFAKYAPQLVPNTMVNMTGPTLKVYQEIYKEQITKALDETDADTTLTPADKEEMLNRLAFADDAFDRAYANNAFGFSPKESQQAGGTPPSPTGGGGAKTT